MRKISEIVDKYLTETGFTLREFADALNQSLAEKVSVSHASISNWRTGVYKPSTDFLSLMLLKYRDWRFDFALECLAAQNPDIWGFPEGAVWMACQELDRRTAGGSVESSLNLG